MSSVTLSLKFFTFGKFSGSSPINTVCLEPGKETAYKAQALRVFAQLRNINLDQQSRQKIATDQGAWFCFRDLKDFVYLVLVIPSYPERHAYAAIKALQTHLEKLGNYELQPDSALRIHSKGTMSQICAKYNDLKLVDKIYEGKERVSKIKEEMTTNINKLLTNEGNLVELQGKAELMKNNAAMFERNAHELERMMYWRNCKLKIMIAVIVLSGLCYIIVPIVIKFAPSN